MISPACALSKWSMPLQTFLPLSHNLNFASKTTKYLPPSIPKWLFKQTHTAAAHYQLKPFNSKISNFMRNGLVEDAQKLFDEMPQRNTVTWNAMISGYFRNGWSHRALSLFHQMPTRDIYSYNTVIGGLMCCGDVRGANDVFEAMPFRDVVTWNSMVSGYIHNGMLDGAVSVFNTMPVKDVVSWNLVIGGLVNCGELDLARKRFYDMGNRDVASWTIMISGLVGAGFVGEARHLFDQMPAKDTRAWNKIIEGYLKNSDIENALFLFHRMPDKCQRILNMILMGLVENGLVKPAHGILMKTPFADPVSWTNLIVGYFGAAEVDSATKIFEEMKIRDTAVWNATIFGLGENDRAEEGLKLFIRMRDSGKKPDKSTFTSVLKICSELPSLELGEQTHAHVVKTGFSNTTSVSNAMLTMYARCGNMKSALYEFHSMPTRDLISWNSIICGYAHNGDGEKALEMFENMAVLTDVKPNHITFVGVLSACCHAGLIDKGKRYFDIMRREYLIEPTQEHYTCVVDMLGRHGLLQEAMELLEGMREEGVEIPGSVWGALLGACRMYKNIEIGEVVGEKVLGVEPWNSGVYLILAEMYMECGRVGEAEGVLGRMRARGVKKQPGCSWIEVNNQGHVFLAGDGAHPKFDGICSVLRLMHRERGGFSGKWLLYDEIDAELIIYGES